MLSMRLHSQLLLLPVLHLQTVHRLIPCTHLSDCTDALRSPSRTARGSKRTLPLPTTRRQQRFARDAAPAIEPAARPGRLGWLPGTVIQALPVGRPDPRHRTAARIRAQPQSRCRSALAAGPHRHRCCSPPATVTACRDWTLVSPGYYLTRRPCPKHRSWRVRLLAAHP